MGEQLFKDVNEAQGESCGVESHGHPLLCCGGKSVSEIEAGKDWTAFLSVGSKSYDPGHGVHLLYVGSDLPLGYETPLLWRGVFRELVRDGFGGDGGDDAAMDEAATGGDGLTGADDTATSR